MRFIVLPACAALLLVPARAATPSASVSAASILARTKILASDELEGRAPGTTGEEKTVHYLVSEFQKLGLAPGNPDGSYVQAVPLIGITSTVAVTFSAGVRDITPTPVTEFSALSRRLTPAVKVDASDIIFVGYGVVAPEYRWDDFKGVDVRGKTVLMLVNDPPVTDATGRLDDAVFRGRAMTYYGRWTYKYEIASARGAAACLIIHETGPAGYPFAVVGGSAGRENFDVDTPDANAGRVAVEGWLHLDTAKKLLAAGGHDFAALKAAAARRDFRPVPIAAKATFTVANTTRRVASKNVVALLPGTDPKLRDDYLVYSAHWDAFGRDPKLPGDQILNGAADNAIALAMMLEIAQVTAALPPAGRPRRSLLFFAPTGEEKGLLGSRYYATRPLYPLARTVANINLEPLDANGAYGPTRDIEVVGTNASTLDDIGAALAVAQGRVIRPDTEPEKGYYYRSDHFEFAKVGVPAYFTRSGLDFLDQPPGYGLKLRQSYLENDYHKVTDEVKPGWTMQGAAQSADFLLQVGLSVANADTRPEWKPGTEFKAVRDAMLKNTQP